MSILSKSKIVRVEIAEGKEGLFYATSPDLKGLLVAEPDIESLDLAIPLAIMQFFEVCGVRTIVTKAERENEEFHPWIAIPAEVAEKALASLH